ncbi:hypothetical protein PSHT_03990 [Puccinia striiformis]|uniref:OTU domain-containing protein n=1 Tax=Puccinia striiformis TaxID=27350 RepID=A0A2S4WEA5_9BASI|nr:hypothetical protein PSHT_03990 [Puccinia striiformis]
MVKDIFNPHGDGHCGFRCVSRALGSDNDSSNGFLRVRQEMIAEIEGNRPTYLKWLDKMSHGQILANAYSRPIVFLSIVSSNSFIPSRVSPPPQGIRRPRPSLHTSRERQSLGLASRGGVGQTHGPSNSSHHVHYKSG